MTLTLEQHPLAVHGLCMDPTGTLVCRMHETHVLGDDAVEVLRPPASPEKPFVAASSSPWKKIATNGPLRGVAMGATLPAGAACA